MKNRDVTCRIHRVACPSNNRIAGHIIGLNDPILLQFFKNDQSDKLYSIINSVTNGILWCDIMENLYSKYLFCIDTMV